MIELTVHIKDGAITNKTAVKNAFNNLVDGAHFVTIKKRSKKRSNLQNAYLHGCLFLYMLEGLRDAGYDEVKDMQDAKDVAKHLFLKRHITNKETGELIATIVRPTSELTTTEMMQFIEDCVKFSAEYLNTIIPYPGQSEKMFDK